MIRHSLCMSCDNFYCLGARGGGGGDLSICMWGRSQGEKITGGLQKEGITGGGGGGEIGEGDHSGERCKEKEEGWEEEGIAGRGNPDGE